VVLDSLQGGDVLSICVKSQHALKANEHPMMYKGTLGGIFNTSVQLDCEHLNSIIGVTACHVIDEHMKEDSDCSYDILFGIQCDES